MEERTLARLCLGVSLIGILLLYPIAGDEPQEGMDAFLTGEDDESVRIRGTISSIDAREDLTLIELVPDDTIRITVFDDVGNEFREGHSVLVQGRISDHEDFPRGIIAEDMRETS